MLGAVALFGAVTAFPESPVTIVKAARLIDGRGGPPMAPAMVRIEGDRIAEVGKAVAIPAGARVVDLGDATLLPGLIDLHTHLTDKYGIHWEDVLTTTTPPEAALWGAKNARDTLMAGFTTCREMGPTWPYVDVALRNAIDQGAVPGPRLFVAGNYISSTGGAGDARQFSIYVDVPIVRNLADSARGDHEGRPHQLQERRRLPEDPRDGSHPVEGHLARGAAVFGRGDPGGGRRGRPLGPAGRGACARRQGNQGRDPRRRAHGRSRLAPGRRGGRPPAAERRKTFYVPTLGVSEAIESGAANAPPSEVERSRQIRELMVAGFRRALAAGLPIGFATDSGVTPHGQQRPRAGRAGRLRRDADVGDRLGDEPERRDPGLVGPRRARSRRASSRTWWPSPGTR